jgi:hypothetical protein
VLRHQLALAFDAVAQLRPAAAIVIAELAHQGGTVVARQCPEIGATHRGRGHRYPRTDVELNAERQSVTALAEIDHAETVAPADRDRAAGRAHHLFTIRFRQMADAEIGKRGIAERHGRRRQLILLETRNGCKVTELG